MASAHTVISLSAGGVVVSAITLWPLVWRECMARVREHTYLLLLKPAVAVKFLSMSKRQAGCHINNATFRPKFLPTKIPKFLLWGQPPRSPNLMKQSTAAWSLRLLRNNSERGEQELRKETAYVCRVQSRRNNWGRGLRPCCPCPWNRRGKEISSTWMRNAQSYR